MSVVIKMPHTFAFLFEDSRYKAMYGGRGSAKSHSCAGALVSKAFDKPLRILCGREIQKSIKDSVKRLIEDKISEYGLRWFYKITDSEIRGKNGSLFIFSGVKNNPESIKSMEGVDIAWFEEANTISQRSLDIVIPTIRKEGSEIWFTWNPENDTDPIDIMFRGDNPPTNAIIRSVNYTENPFCPNVLIDEAEFLKKTDIEKYNHVWLGGYKAAAKGAYYAKELARAASEKRICRVPYDSSVPVYASFDLGISDSTAIWLFQYVGTEIHFLEFFESNGEKIEWYVSELKKRPYIYAPLILPHDAEARELGTGKSTEEVIRSLGMETTIVPKLSVKMGIDEVRRKLDRSWFDIDLCKEGLKHLRSYKENFDERNNISRGPLHDEHSHCADSIRYGMTAEMKIAGKQDIKKIQQAINSYRVKSISSFTGV